MLRGPARAGADLFRRAPQADDIAQAWHPRGEVQFVQPQRQLSRCNQRIAGLFVDLLFQRLLVEWMVEHQRSARQQPDRQRRGEAGKRHRRERRQDRCALRHVAFERHRKATGNQAEMGARDRPEAVRSDVEGNQRRLAAVLDHGARGQGFPENRVVERGHAFGQVAAEAADMADRERFGGGVHGDVRIDHAVDLARGHDPPRGGAVERHGQFRLPPEQRQHRDDEAGAEGGEHGEREFDGVGQLNRDHGIGRQAGFDEVRGQRRDHAVGLRKGKTLRRLAGDALLVEGIDQRQRIRLSRQVPFEQRIERWRSGGLGHGVTSALSRGWIAWRVHFVSGFRHQVSGR